MGEPFDAATDAARMPQKTITEEGIIDELLKKIKEHTTYLRLIDDSRLREVVARMQTKTFIRLEKVFKRGDPGEGLYIVKNGTFEEWESSERNYDEYGYLKGVEDFVVQHSQNGKTYGDGNPCFGEFSLIHPQICDVTVKAAHDNSKCYFIDRLNYTRIVLGIAHKRRMRFMMLLNNCHLFDQVREHEKLRVRNVFKMMKFEENKIIFEIDDEPDGMYWIESGVVGIEGSEETLKKNEFFGEMGMILSETRTETYIAKSESCELAFLSVEAFEEQLGKLRNMMLRDQAQYKKFCKDHLDTEEPCPADFR